MALVAIALLIAVGNFVIDKDDPNVSEAQASETTNAVAARVVMFTMPHDIKVMKLRWKQAAAAKAAVEEARRERQAELKARFAKLPAGVELATLESIASCESGGDPRIVSSDGSYRGKYQFSVDTWQSVGGSGMPDQASEAEQDFRAALLYVRSGPGQWPVCGS